MKSFKEFLGISGFNIEQFAADCAPILKQYSETSRVLYTGKKGLKGFGPYKWEPRDGPKDTPQPIHDAMNFNFKKELNRKPRNWLFATPATGQARAYGQVYAFFPIGPNFEFIYSDMIYDATNEYSRMKTMFKNSHPDLTFDQRVHLIIDTIKDHFVNDYDFKLTSDITDLLASHVDSEVMTKCERYYLIDITSAEYSAICKEFKLRPAL